MLNTEKKIDDFLVKLKQELMDAIHEPIKGHVSGATVSGEWISDKHGDLDDRESLELLNPVFKEIKIQMLTIRV